MRVSQLLSAVLGWLMLLVLAAPSSAATAFGEAFWEHWGDGQAELAAYDLVYPRYGEDRPGVAVTIFVTETFSRDLRVKADPGNHDSDDEVPVMKLNLIEDFPTGIYDYNLMTSAFVVLADTPELSIGTPIKVSFSAQEWCGHRWLQSLWDENSVRIEGHSYFDGEADEAFTLGRPGDDTALRGGGSSDLLLLWARGLAAPFLGAGESAMVQLLEPLQDISLRHEAHVFVPMLLHRSVSTETIVVPAGSYECEVHTAQFEDPPPADSGDARAASWKFWVGKAAPHHLIRWQEPSGKQGSLLGVTRMAYWKLNGPDGIDALEELGLDARAPRTP